MDATRPPPIDELPSPPPPIVVEPPVVAEQTVPPPRSDGTIEQAAAAELAAASIWAQPAVDLPSAEPPVPDDPAGTAVLPEMIAPESEVPTATGPVPTWAFPSLTQSRPLPPPAPSVGDLTLDPASLRRKVTIRSGSASLTVDETTLVVRQWLRKRPIAWPTVHGFEPRFDGDPAAGALGWLVAVTDSGPIDLPATKRSAADLRYVHALLDAYRQRARQQR